MELNAAPTEDVPRPDEVVVSAGNVEDDASVLSDVLNMDMLMFSSPLMVP